MRKSVKIGNHVIQLWVFAVVCISIIAAGVLANYVLTTRTVPIEQVCEHIELLAYPSNAILSPGEYDFNVTVNNNASVTYDVVLSYLLGNETYQENYVTFSSETYSIIPGQQDVVVWVTVNPDAPSLITTLDITVQKATPIS